MTEDPKTSSEPDTPEGPEKDPQSSEVGATDATDDGPGAGRTDGQQNPLVHEGAPADPQDDSNERADAAVEIQQPDGSRAPQAED